MPASFTKPAIFAAGFCLAAALALAPVAHAEPVPQSESLSRLVELAIANNPDIMAAALRWESLQRRAKQAGSWEDPMLMLKIQNGLVKDPLNFSKDSMTQKVIGISQQIPYFGKRALREEVAAQEAEINHYSHEEMQLEIVRMVKETYYQIYFADRALGIVDRNLGIIDTFVTLAETKYTVGQGAQQDIYKAQLERSKMLDMRITLEQQRKSLGIALNSLLYRPLDTPIGPIADFTIGKTLPSAQELVETAEKNRPVLKGVRAQLLKGESSLDLAKKESFPDFNVSFEYMQRDRAMGSDGSDMYTLGVTFNLPIRKEKREAMRAEANSEIMAATQEMRATRNKIATGVSDLLAQMERRRKLVELYQTGIIPQAEQALESATIAYRVNKADFLSLLDSRVNLFNYEREYFDSLADYQMKKAQLEALVGQALE